MNVDEARQLFDDAVNAVLAGRRVAAGHNGLPARDGSVYESADKFLDELNSDVYKLLVDAIDVLQDRKLIALEGFTISEFPAERTLKEQVMKYVRILLIQEGKKSLLQSPRANGTV